MLELRGITKRFGSQMAVSEVSLSFQGGKIHTLLGENGAGKSTLMNLIYGLYQPNEGEILIDDQVVKISSPNVAVELGIGMVHQHFMLVPTLTVAENIFLSQPLKQRKDWVYKANQAEQLVEELCQRHGGGRLSVDPKAKIQQLPVGQQQRVEILKALAIEARILILDEPTAVLTPKEIDDLFQVLDQLRADGRLIIFISHKLREVMAISDQISVLRKGLHVMTTNVNETSAADLAEQMIGRPVPPVHQRSEVESDRPVLEIERITVLNDSSNLALNDCTMTVRRGEIVGIAGIDGNGQIELAQTIMGLQKVKLGHVRFYPSNEPQSDISSELVTNIPTHHLRQKSYGYIPSDRHTDGLVLPFSLSENLLLNPHQLKKHLNTKSWFSFLGIVLDRDSLRSSMADLVQKFDIRTPSTEISADALSGGNQQKVIIARELSTNPDFLLAVNPTRGLDIGAIDYVHQQLLDQRHKQRGVLLISSELDEVLALSDRIFVIFDGQLTLATDFRNNLSRLGQMMIGESSNKE